VQFKDLNFYFFSLLFLREQMRDKTMDKTTKKKCIGIILDILGILTILLLIISTVYAQPIYEGVNYIDLGLDEIISWRIYNNDSYVNAYQFNLTTIIVTIPELSSPSNFAIEMRGYKNEEERVVHLGGGTRTVWRDRNNTVYVDKPRDVIVEKEVVKEVNNTITLGVSDEEEGVNKLWMWGAIAFGVILFGSLIAVIFANRGSNEDSFGARPGEVTTP
jgi:hypothetical protein